MASIILKEKFTQYVFDHIIFSCITSVALCIALIFVLYFQPPTLDPGEPPLAKPTLPILGHWFGFRRHQIQYLELLRRRTSSGPAYTVEFLSRKTYVITSYALAHIALRSKSLSLEPLSARIMGPLLGLSEGAIRQLGIGEHGQWLGSPGMTERRVDLNKNLAPGDSLLDMGTQAAAEVATVINRLGQDGITVDLYSWLRDAITIATAVGLFGKFNPLSVDNRLINDVWTFDKYQLFLTLNLLPSLLASQGIQARERLVKGFHHYFQNNSEQNASFAVRSAIEILRKHGASNEDHCRIEVFNLSVATVNTAPTAVWMLLHVLANPDLLHSARREMEDNVLTVNGSEVQIHLSRLSSCPLLHAMYKEALRLGSIPTCNRVCLEDTTFIDPDSGKSIFLKKGTRTVIPSYMLHWRQSVWSEHKAFRPSRFMDDCGDKSSENRSNNANKKAQNNSFVPYGGGVHLCPGRHFAELEILATTALVILATDVQMLDGSNVQVPATAISSGVIKPAKPMIVNIKKRSGWEDKVWNVKT